VAAVLGDIQAALMPLKQPNMFVTVACVRGGAGSAFTSSRVECRSGDVFALLTDGLIEVFDAANRELGFEWAKTALGKLADRPLPEIADHLLAGARSHGAQLDDQTVLLIRRAHSPRGTVALQPQSEPGTA
jgi:serine/threonine protein phosphatase PrpC